MLLVQSRYVVVNSQPSLLIQEISGPTQVLCTLLLTGLRSFFDTYRAEYYPQVVVPREFPLTGIQSHSQFIYINFFFVNKKQISRTPHPRSLALTIIYSRIHSHRLRSSLISGSIVVTSDKSRLLRKYGSKQVGI